MTRQVGAALPGCTAVRCAWFCFRMSSDSTPGKPGLAAEVTPGGDCGGVLTTMPSAGTGVLVSATAAPAASSVRPIARPARNFFMGYSRSRHRSTSVGSIGSVSLDVLVLGLRPLAQLGFPARLVGRRPVLDD